MADVTYTIGSIVKARSREWIVQSGSTDTRLRLRPLSGSEADETVIVPSLEVEPPTSAAFAPPDPAKLGNAAQAELLRAALRMKLRSGAGPFRSFGNLGVSPRPYQLVPLLMALKMPVTRLLVADDVGIGKTIEAALVVRELFDRGEISRFAVLCPPHLVDQWAGELKRHFNFNAVALTGRTVSRLERDIPEGESIFDHYKAVVISLDYIKSETHRYHFLSAAPEFIIVDEAHTCSYGGTGLQYRYKLVGELAKDASRHMLLLTATPHSGDREAFYRLIALLKPEFYALMDERKDDKELRAELGRHFVQRHRIDIENEWGGKSIFPKRLTKDADYSMTADWSAFLKLIYEHCQELAKRASDEGCVNAAFYGYTALALLRCASSSPAAAVMAFQNRLDRLASEDEAPIDDEEDDSLPNLVGFENAADLREMKRMAERLADSQDPKLAALDKTLDELFKGSEPFHPVVFCSYIETAKYVAEHLQKRYSSKGFDVRAVTGEIASDDRELIVNELAESEKRILVATDCLSEGINLQHGFDAVVHYDMVWNPTRHEQREGRVDRYGQPRTEVKCAMLYSHDNAVDGLVLNVIVRKAKEIRKELGISVPVPADDSRINAAILQAFLLKSKPDPHQTDFFDKLFDGAPELKAIDDIWSDAREREKKNRTIFAQKGLRPEDVAPELEKTTAALGTEADVARFVSHALAALSAPLGEQSGIYSFSPQLLEKPIRERLEEAGVAVEKPRKIAFLQSAADGHPGVEFISRTNPLVSVLADCTLESALADEPSGKVLAVRAAAFRSKDVASKTVLAVLRLRHQLKRTKDGVERTMIGEETVSLISTGNGPFQPVDKSFVSPAPSGDINSAAAEKQITDALARLAASQSELDAIAKERAEALLADHRNVRDASGDKGAYSVSPVLPSDIMGVYVFLPPL